MRLLFFIFFSLLTQAQIQIGGGTTTQNDSPINSYYGYNYSQQIYYSSEIGVGGTINSISFYLSSGNGTNSNSWAVYLGHTNQNSFTVSSWIPRSSLTEVFNGTVTFPASGNWLTINFTTPFVYNGSDNLVIAVDENTPGFTTSSNTSYWRSTSTTSTTTIYFNNDNINPNPSSPPISVGTSTKRVNVILGGLPICLPPINQATNLTFGSISTSSISASFTAANSNPSGYLIVRSTNATPPTPVDGTTYATGSTTLGANTYVISSGSSTTFTSSSLTSNTTYFYHIFSYNSSGCSGGPKYNFSAPLSGSITTCLSGTPSTPTLSNETTNSIQASWTAFPGATSYRLDVSTNSSFSSFVSGYQDLVVNGVNYYITGLNPNTLYYVRVRAHNESCPSSSSSSVNKTTLKIEPNNQPTNFVAGTVTTSNIPLSWTTAVAGNQAPDGYLIKGSATSVISISDPVDGVDSINETSFSDGIVMVKTTTNPYSSFTNQTAGKMYYYKIYSYTNTTTSSTSSTIIDYKTDSVPILYHATLPAVNTATIFSATTSNATTISWTQPSSYSNSNHSTLVFVKAGSAVTLGTPTLSPNNYNGNSIFSLGTAYENDTSAYCIYNGDLTTITVQGLNGNTNYHVLIVTVVENSNSNGTNSYSATLTSNKTTLCNPTDSFNITFEETSNLPTCTSFLSSDNQGANINTTNPYQGTRCLGLQSSTTFLLPNVNNAHLNTHQISFYAKTAINTNDTIGFGYLTDPLNATTYINLQSFTLNSTYQLCNYVPINNIPQNTTLAIKMTGSAVLLVDNIVWEPKPNIVWSNQSWSNISGPTQYDNAIIQDNLSLLQNLNTNNLIVNSNYTVTVNPNLTLNIYGNLINNGSIVFKSDAIGSGFFGPFNGTLSGSGSVTVERFIPQGKRAFRLLSPAVTTTNNISNNWQQAIHITGSTTGANGFDATETGNPSMFIYNNQVALGTGWTAIANTNATNLNAGVGYRMLVRGDRTATNITAATTDNMNAAITLSATGTLRTGTVTLNSSSTPAINNTSNTTTADYSLVGNPYQSAVDWNAVTKSGIDATYFAWDPNMGTSTQRGRYVAFNGTTNDNNLSQVGQYIQPGQAFFVKNTVSGTAGTLTFQEANKAATGASVFRMANPNATSAATSLSVQLYEPNELAIDGYPIDAMKAVFNSDYQNELGIGDATKLESAGENIAWFRNNTKLAIDAAAPLTATDELLMKTLRLGANKNYAFKIQTTSFDSNLTPYLVDNFLNTQTEISTTQPFLASFATTTDNASYNENRFKIIFQTNTLSTDDFEKNISLYPNPSKLGESFYVQGVTKAHVSVYTFLGQNIPIQLKFHGNLLQVIPIQSVSRGVYLINLTIESKTLHMKWIVE